MTNTYLYCPECGRVGCINMPSTSPGSVFRCGRCQKKGAYVLSTPTNPVDYYLTHSEFLMVQYGLGTPDEHEVTEAALYELLVGARVIGLGTEPIPNTTQCVLNSIEFDNGITVHLTASANGATVYRLQKPFKSTSEDACQQ